MLDLHSCPRPGAAQSESAVRGRDRALFGIGYQRPKAEAVREHGSTMKYWGQSCYLLVALPQDEVRSSRAVEMVV